MNATILESLANHPLVTSIGWTLIHFVWQAALVAAVIGLTLGIMGDWPARIRYLFGLGGLAIMATIPIGTFIYLISATATDDWKIVTRVDSMNLQNGQNNAATPTLRGDVDVVRNLQWFPRNGSNGAGEFPGAMADVVDSKSMRASVGWISKTESLARTMQQWLPWCVVVWFVGVSCLACRLLAGLQRVWLWRSKGKEIVGGDLAATVARLSRQMKLRQPIRLLATVRETAPAVIGWMRPAILIPTSMLTGLTARELESILAHELAHIRRHDYLVNLLQTVVETLLFYHPAVWWLSNRIRIERENCCDDIAVEVCGNRVAFARALTRLEELRSKHDRLSVAANGGSLVHRIRRIVLAKPQSNDSWWPAGAIVLAGLAVLTSGLLMSVASGDASVPGVADKAGSAIVKNVTSGAAVLADANQPENDEYPLHKPEIERVDAKTGQSHRVMADVKLSVGEKPPVLVDLKYSNLFNYTFIPERIALELQAVELGVIDFGENPQPQSAGQRLQIDWQRLVPPPAGTDTKPIEKPAAVESDVEVVTVDQLVKPAGERRIVPYAADAIWIPDHLAFYGVNANGQTKFRVVRIDQVDLGIGPAFGPVNALVIDEANTDLGVLGSNWARIPRGRNGEGFVWAAVGGFYFMAMEPPDSPLPGAVDPAMESDRPLVMPGTQNPEFKTVKSYVFKFGIAADIAPIVSARFNTPSDPIGTVVVSADNDTNSLIVVASEADHERIQKLIVEIDSNETADEIVRQGSANNAEIGRRTLASHTYDMKTRQSTGWVEIDGTRVPVDKGVEYGGIRAYVTLMFGVVGVDSKSDTVVWHVPRNKSDPIWRTISIVELTRAEIKTVVIELTSAETEADKEGTRRRLRLDNGQPIEDQQPAPSQQAAGPQLTVVQRDGERIELATLENQIRKFTAAELVRRHHDAFERFGSPEMAGWLTAEETLVSSERPNYVLGNEQNYGMDAREVVFNLPEGSDIRAEFSGKSVEIQSLGDATNVRITDGRLRLIDAGGVIRADASPDGGAELLIVECREAGDEYTMKLRTGWSDASNDSETPPVQVKMNLASGAPTDEEQPPHGAVRFRIEHDASANSPMKLKIRWHHDLKRLAEEAVQETGKSRDKILIDDSDASKTSIPFQTFDNAAADDDWGPQTKSSALRLRLTVSQPVGKAGDPVLCKLELRNFGTEVESYDPQVFAPFRVVKANNAAGQSDWFIGPIAQTFGRKTPLRPNNTAVLWEDVDIGDLYLLDEGQYELSVVQKGFINQPSLSSNTVSIRVAAGQLPPRKQLLKQLRDVVPAGWIVSSSFFGIDLSHSPTGLKEDVTSIQIWFTDKVLPDDFELGQGDARQIINQVGHCELGFMNVAGSQRADSLWPDYLAAIRNAATRALNFAADNGAQPDESNLDQSNAIERIEVE